MLRCPVCQSEFPDGTSKCAFCGAALEAAGTEKNTGKNGNRENGSAVTPAGRKKQNKIWIGAAILGIILILAYGVGNTSEEKNDRDGEYNTTSVNQETVPDGAGMGETALEGTEEMEEAAYDPAEGGIHRYEYVQKDCTWQEAFEECLSRGGYLARINSREEYEYILDEIQTLGMENINFFLGGRRDIDGTEYYWVDENDQLYGEQINSGDYWCRDEWLAGEPSFRDDILDLEEDCLDIFYHGNTGKWVWNDVTNDILSILPGYSGKIGYICEYEE